MTDSDINPDTVACMGHSFEPKYVGKEAAHKSWLAQFPVSMDLTGNYSLSMLSQEISSTGRKYSSLIAHQIIFEDEGTNHMIKWTKMTQGMTRLQEIGKAATLTLFIK